MEINGTLSAIVTGGASGLGEATARCYHPWVQRWLFLI